MNNEKLTGDMSVMDMVMTMSEGNPGAIQILAQMMNDHRRFIDILLCDSLDIRGSKLYMLNNDCCGRNMDKFDRTLMMLRCGVFSQEDIHKNLELIRAIPFIDDSIVIEGVPPYGEHFGPTDEKWDEFCSKNKEAFLKKLSIAIGNDENNKTI